MKLINNSLKTNLSRHPTIKKNKIFICSNDIILNYIIKNEELYNGVFREVEEKECMVRIAHRGNMGIGIKNGK